MRSPIVEPGGTDCQVFVDAALDRMIDEDLGDALAEPLDLRLVVLDSEVHP